MLKERFLSRIDGYTQDKSKVYIIPTKAGFKYVFINFTVFLMAMSYTNNLCLLISFIMISYFILQMLDTHKIIQDLEIKDISIADHFQDFTTAKIRFDNIINKENSKYLKISLFKRNISYNSTSSSIINANLVDFKLSHLKRGHYKIKKIKFYTTGKSNLFYVWRYHKQDISFYTYPKKEYLVWNKKANDNSAKIGHHEAEFSEHIFYRPGMNSKRIDWKIYSRTDQLYLKKHIDFHNITFEINYNQIEGDKEKKLSHMSYLISQCFQESRSWKLVLPNKILSSDKSRNHYRKSMEALSDF